MASVSGVSSSKSIYGNRNVLSGLASGLDTESMIENAISAYKNKITALQKKRTKTEWKQEAYRSIIDKMSVFSDKYTSYNSASNLMSSSFFNQAVTTVAKGGQRLQGVRRRPDQQQRLPQRGEAAGHLRPLCHQRQQH